MNDTIGTGPLPDMDALVAELVEGRIDLSRRLFEAADLAVPWILWEPRPASLGHPLIERFDAIASRMARADGGIALEDLDLDAFDGLRGWLMLLEPAPEEGLRYLDYGREIVEAYGSSMSRRTTRDLPAFIAAFFEATYRAVAGRRAPLLTEHEPPTNIFVERWRRLIYPVVDGDEVVRFLAINVPQNAIRSGLDVLPDPVFLLDDAGLICYANRPARELALGERAAIPVGSDLFQTTGIALPEVPPPEAMLLSRRVQTFSVAAVRYGRILPVTLRVAATTYRRRAFHVVIVTGFRAASG